MASVPVSTDLCSNVLRGALDHFVGSVVEARIAEGSPEELEQWLECVIAVETLEGTFVR
ncbi:MAG: hypothetical protein JRH11_24975 [Deltaproteobacteria bacterium]|nr:hypothetical protein [Deltaproteobacteria bacterium]